MTEPYMFMSPSRSNVPGKSTFHVPVTFGAASVSSYNKASEIVFARTGAGTYTVTFPKAYRKLVGISGVHQKAAGATLIPAIASETLATDGVINLELRDGAGAATDPGNGEKVYFTFDVSDDTAGDRFYGA